VKSAQKRAQSELLSTNFRCFLFQALCLAFKTRVLLEQSIKLSNRILEPGSDPAGTWIKESYIRSQKKEKLCPIPQNVISLTGEQVVK